MRENDAFDHVQVYVYIRAKKKASMCNPNNLSCSLLVVNSHHTGDLSYAAA